MLKPHLSPHRLVATVLVGLMCAIVMPTAAQACTLRHHNFGQHHGRHCHHRHHCRHRHHRNIKPVAVKPVPTLPPQQPPPAPPPQPLPEGGKDCGQGFHNSADGKECILNGQ